MVKWLVVYVVSLTTKLSITDITISVDSILLMLLQLLITPEFLRASGTLVRIYSVRVFLMLSIVDQSAKLPIAIIACLWDSILLMLLQLLIRSEFLWAGDTFLRIHSVCIFLMLSIVDQSAKLSIADITCLWDSILLMSLPLLIRSEFHWASDTFVGIYSMCTFQMMMVVNQTTEIQIADITTFVHYIFLVFW